MAKYEKNLSTRRSTPRHPIAMASTAKPPNPMPCALASILLSESRARPPDICGKPCFRGPTGCILGVDAFGPFLRAGYTGAAWVRGGSLGRGMRAGRRCLAPRVGGESWSGSPSNDADTRARCAGGHVGGWATLCLPAVRGQTCVGAWAGASSGGSFGASALVSVWGLPLLLHGGWILCRKVPNNAYSQDSQEFAASVGAY